MQVYNLTPFVHNVFYEKIVVFTEILTVLTPLPPFLRGVKAKNL